MVRHVKLFENWAEENVNLPEWLDSNKKIINGKKTLYHPDIINKIKNLDLNNLILEKINFKSFSDYSFWKKDGYNKIQINQEYCEYPLEDCFGMPDCNYLSFMYTKIKSLKGLENKEFIEKFSMQHNYIENLKYCPISSTFDFYDNPLLSYYGTTSDSMINLSYDTLCGASSYAKAGYDKSNKLFLKQLNDPEFNAEIFCYFPFKKDVYNYSYCVSINPWINIYEDPNEVENYDFLFVPFYLNSENFRDKAKEYIKNLDAGNLDRSDLW